MGCVQNFVGARCSVVVEALCYKPESRGGSRPDKANDFFSIYLILPAFTQSLTEMSTRRRKIFLENGGADNLATICEPIVYIMWDPRQIATL
jgi:hypothetical protein